MGLDQPVYPGTHHERGHAETQASLSVAQLPVSNSSHNWVHQDRQEQGRNMMLFLNTEYKVCHLILSCVKTGMCLLLIFLCSCQPIKVGSFKPALDL